MRIAVLASGSGSNFQALVDSTELKSAGVQIACLFCNRPDARAIERARKAGIPVEILSHKDFPDREAFDRAVLACLAPYKPDALVMAGYMRVVTPLFIEAYRDRVLNIHPALLPAFPGAHAIRDAWEYGVKVTGVSVHFIDEGTDTGPIILQEALEVHEGESLDDLEARIHEIEHRLYPRAVVLLAQGRLRREGRRVRIIEKPV